ncbi:MAG: hypothetical protein ACI8XZ_003307 [Gammaproteobacteria bacterium]|jgi:hypothetical protein
MIISTMTVSYCGDLLGGIQKLTDGYRLALYDDDSGLSHRTTHYATDGESNGAGYPPGGFRLERPAVGHVGHTVFLRFDNVMVDVSNINPVACLMYNASKENRSVAVMELLVTNTTDGRVLIPSPDLSISMVDNGFGSFADEPVS